MGSSANIDLNGVDTLQAAKRPCSVSDGPVEIKLETLASGGQIYK